MSPPSVIAPFLLVPQPLDFALEAAFLLHGDPLDHRLPLFQRLDLAAQRADFLDHAIVCRVVSALIAIAPQAPAAATEDGADNAGDHDDQHDPEHHFELIHARSFPFAALPAAVPELLDPAGQAVSVPDRDPLDHG